MSLSTLCHERFSARKYIDKKVEEEKIAAILEAGRVAPTAKNNQPQRIYLLKSDEALQKIREITPCTFGAPMVLLVCADESRAWTSPFGENYNSAEMDATISCTHMMLQAKDLGLDSCWVLFFDKNKVRQAFALPEEIKPVCLLDIGYTENCAPSPSHANRKPIDQLVTVL